MPLPELATRLRWLARTSTLMGDVPSAVRFAALKSPLKHRRESPVRLRLRPLGGTPVWVRPQTTDTWSLTCLFLFKDHLPPAELSGPLHRIWDLGANNGLTVAHLATQNPGAVIQGVELDPANAEFARRNLSPWADRCHILNAAVWTDDGEVPYTTGSDDLSHRVEVGSPAPHASVHRVRAISLNTLVDECGNDAVIDYVKMDIEGAEREVLTRNTEWASSVRCIQVEVHPPYTIEDCRRDLERLGFATSVPAFGMADPVVGLRET